MAQIQFKGKTFVQNHHLLVPPYNTGNENWAYNDNVNSPMMQDWLDQFRIDFAQLPFEIYDLAR